MLGFFGNMMFVVSARTALVYMPIMLGLFALLYLGRRATVLLLVGAVAAAALVWSTSPYLRDRIEAVTSSIKVIMRITPRASTGLRLEFWRKSLGFFANAPMFGNGTGSTKQLFERAAIGQSGASAECNRQPAQSDPERGRTVGPARLRPALCDVAVAICCYLAGRALSLWIGLLVVVQNIFSSLFNSHLFDFHEGWMYVLGVGVAGGMALRMRVRTERKSCRQGPLAVGMQDKDKLPALRETLKPDTSW